MVTPPTARSSKTPHAEEPPPDELGGGSVFSGDTLSSDRGSCFYSFADESCGDGLCGDPVSVVCGSFE